MMKLMASRNAKTQTNETSSQNDNAAAEHQAVSLSPPEYGVESVDVGIEAKPSTNLTTVGKIVRERTERQSSSPGRVGQRNRAQSESHHGGMPNQTELKRRLGNLTQTKLIVGQPGDRFERDPDAVAEQVVRGKLVPLNPLADSMLVAASSPSVVQRLEPALVQHRLGIQAARQSLSDSASIRNVAAKGVRGSGGPLPHLETIQAAFGRHDVTTVQAYVGSAASDASRAIGSAAYATGDKVAFRELPTLHTAAHEAAHVIQQRGGVKLTGGIGERGDHYEQHANAVADAVVARRSAQSLLDPYAGPRSDPEGAFLQGKFINVPVDQPGFWTDLAQEVEGDLGRWNNSHFGQAIQTFSTDMLSADNPSAAREGVDAFFDVLGAHPVAGDYIAAGYSVVMRINDNLSNPQGRLRLGDFVNQLAQNQITLNDEISSQENALHARLQGAAAEEEGMSEEESHAHRQRVVDELERLLQSLPTREEILQRMVAHWVGSAQDSWDYGDWSGVDAGYIFLQVEYLYDPPGFHALTGDPIPGTSVFQNPEAPFLDDVALPSQTRAAMTHAFGDDTYLDEIRGIPMNIEVTFRWSWVTGFTLQLAKPRDSTSLVQMGISGGRNLRLLVPHVESKMHSLLTEYKRWAERPRVRDLVND